LLLDVFKVINPLWWDMPGLTLGDENKPTFRWGILRVRSVSLPAAKKAFGDSILSDIGHV
jgi:hypothetical protein